MNTRMKWILSVVTVLALSLVIFTGVAFAQTDTPDEGTTNPLVEMQQWMDEHMGEGSWAAMIQRMTEVHGAEFTGEMLQRMAEGEGCHGQGEHPHADGEYGPGMMGEGFSGHSGRGMMGGGMRSHGMMGGWSNR